MKNDAAPQSVASTEGALTIAPPETFEPVKRLAAVLHVWDQYGQPREMIFGAATKLTRDDLRAVLAHLEEYRDDYFRLLYEKQAKLWDSPTTEPNVSPTGGVVPEASGELAAGQFFDCHYEGNWQKCDKDGCHYERQCKRRTAGPASPAQEPGVPYLCNATRFKMSFSKTGNVNCFWNYRDQLEAQWVALVPAADDQHMKYAAPRPSSPDVSVPLEPTPAMIEAGANHEWSDGYDRQGSHAAGEYREYTACLKHAFGEYGAAVAAEEIYLAMVKAKP